MADDPPASSAEQLRAILAAAGTSGAWDWDIRADTLTVDSRFAELYGLDEDSAGYPLPTSTFYRAIHPEDRARIKIAVAGMLGGGHLFSKEFRVVTPTGATLWMHARGQSHRDVDDEPIGFTGLLVDVTERKRTEERLRIAQSAGGIGSFEYQDGFSTVSVSGEFCRLLGLHPTNRLPVRTINAVLQPGEPLLIPEGDAPGAPESLDGEFRIAFGEARELRWIARRGEILRDGEGSGFRLLGVIYDITRAKQLENELRGLNETLEQRVVQAIAERHEAEEALRQAQKMEAVGHLTGGIAHDFNNLLTVIIGSIDSAIRRTQAGENPRIDRALANAMKGAERAASLTHRLLAFSRRQPLAPRVVDVPRLLFGMADLLTRTITETIAVSIDPSANSWTIEADPHQLENAILNLAVNARDAMPGGGTLTIRATNQTLGEGAGLPAGLAPGDYVAISVADTGSGMDEDTLARVFDPFFTTKEVGKGTGLGLSMVYGFAKQSEGEVLIASALGHGTTVTLLLPRSAEAAEAERKVDDGTHQRGVSEETILVVEDDDDVRAYTVGALRELGYRVIEAPDGDTALLWLRRQEEPVHLLVTDVVMPRMSGHDLALAARAIHPDLKILYTSGYPRDAVSRDGRIDAGIELLAKPFTLKTLAARARELLDRR